MANPKGAAYVDLGVGAFLKEEDLLSHPSVPDANWVKHAKKNMGRVQVPTLRNVDKRPHGRNRSRECHHRLDCSENVRARLRVFVKRILRKHGYPPDKQEKATQTVLEQAEVLSATWAV